MSGAVASGFRSRLRSGETVVGSFVNLGSPLVTEIMGIAGLDWLVVDLEHGAGDEARLLGQLQALSGTGTATLVRVEAIDLPRFMHALDLGADGVLVPRLRSVEDARRCVEYCRYAGLRGVARYNRSWHWGRTSRTLAEADDETVCAVQIETREALEAVDEIAAVDGVDILFVGPVDLAHSLGLAGPADSPELMEVVAGVAAAANRERQGRRDARRHRRARPRAYREAGFKFLGLQLGRRPPDDGAQPSVSDELAALGALNGPAGKETIRS